MTTRQFENLSELASSSALLADVFNRCSLFLGIDFSLSKKPLRILADINFDSELIEKVEGSSYSAEDEDNFLRQSEDKRQAIEALQEMMKGYGLVEYARERKRSKNAITLAFGYSE